MGYNEGYRMDQVTLGAAYTAHGHIYVVSGRYLHMHIYTSEESVASYVAWLLNGRKRWHAGTWLVLVTSRKALLVAAKKIMQYTIPENQKAELRLVVLYCNQLTKAGRERVAAQLKALMKPDVVPDAQDEVGVAASDGSADDRNDGHSAPESDVAGEHTPQVLSKQEPGGDGLQHQAG